jgi:uncharacterized protein DUF5667
VTVGRTQHLADQLDDVLSGRLATVPDGLGPLVAIADELRAELAELELDRSRAEGHLKLVYLGNRPARPQQRLVRRMLVAAVAAALLLLPATAASGASLPGSPLYPVKRAVEAARLTVARTPQSQATQRTMVARARLTERDKLMEVGDTARVPTATVELGKALSAAEVAVAKARLAGTDLTVVTGLEDELHEIREQATEVPVAPGRGPGATRAPAGAHESPDAGGLTPTTIPAAGIGQDPAPGADPGVPPSTALAETPPVSVPPTTLPVVGTDPPEAPDASVDADGRTTGDRGSSESRDSGDDSLVDRLIDAVLG